MLGRRCRHDHSRRARLSSSYCASDPPGQSPQSARWHLLDITNGRSPPAAQGGVAAFALDGLEHVLYIDAGGSTHELTHVTGDVITRWPAKDLTKLTHAPTARLETSLSAIVAGYDQTAFYTGLDGDIQNLLWDWSGDQLKLARSTNITSSAHGQKVRRGTALISSRLGNTQHVFYINADGDVHELRMTKTTNSSLVWRDHTINSHTNAAVGASQLTGYVMGVSQHLIYLDDYGHVRELYADWSGDDWAAWQKEDLTQRTSAPTPAKESGLQSYVVRDVAHLIMVTSEGRLLDLNWDYNAGQSTGWHYVDITSNAGAPNAATSTGLTAFALDGVQYIDYVDTKGHVIEVTQLP